jgi:hypothetical protein
VNVPLFSLQACHLLMGVCCAVLLERMRWDARRMYQLHSIGGHPPPVQDCIAFDNNDDECPTAFFCCPCAFLQLAAEWRVRIGADCAQYCTWNTMHTANVRSHHEQVLVRHSMRGLCFTSPSICKYVWPPALASGGASYHRGPLRCYLALLTHGVGDGWLQFQRSLEDAAAVMGPTLHVPPPQQEMDARLA